MCECQNYNNRAKDNKKVFLSFINIAKFVWYNVLHALEEMVKIRYRGTS